MKRPILVGGIALSLGLWGLDSLGHLFSNVSTVGLIAAAGAGWWWYQRQLSHRIVAVAPTPVTPEAINQVLTDVDVIVQQLLKESVAEPSVAESASNPASAPAQPQTQPWLDWANQVRSQVESIRASLTTKTLQAVLVGGSGVGKSTLLQQLQSDVMDTAPWQVTWTEAPTLFAHATESFSSGDRLDSPVIRAADLVLLITAGDLTEPEYEVLQALQSQQKPFVVVLNKQDHLLPGDREVLIQHLQHRLQPLTEAENLVAIAANPNPIKVRRLDANGNTQEWLETQQPDLEALKQRLSAQVVQEGEQMRWKTAFQNATDLKTTVKAELNQLRRDRARPLVENYQWISAGAAFVNPLPALDLLATAAVSTQMVLELGEVYQQKLSIAHAQTISGEIAKLLVKLGIVELASQAIASTLKTNFVTYVAGGTMQGISAAYLTRLAGLSLIDYFQSQDVVVPSAATSAFSLQMLQERLQSAFQTHQQALNLQQFVTQGLKKLIPDRTRVSTEVASGV